MFGFGNKKRIKKLESIVHGLEFDQRSNVRQFYSDSNRLSSLNEKVSLLADKNGVKFEFIPPHNGKTTLAKVEGEK